MKDDAERKEIRKKLKSENKKYKGDGNVICSP